MPYITEYTELKPKERRQLFYKRKYKEERPEWDDTMVLLRDLVDKHVPNSATILDVGCGHGNFVIDELKGKFSRKVGVDAAKESVAKNICLDEIQICNSDNMPFKDASFDAAISLWVLEHLENPIAAFREVARVLKPGGIFAFATPNRRSWLVAARRLMRSEWAEKAVALLYDRNDNDMFPVQYRANTLRELGRLARESGFQPVVLRENPDPSYTSFGKFSYRCSEVMARTRRSCVMPHVIGILKK